MKKYEIEEDDLMQLIIDSLTLRDLYIGGIDEWEGYKFVENDEAIIKEAEYKIEEYKEINKEQKDYKESEAQEILYLDRNSFLND